MIAMAITYPSTGRTVSKSPMVTEVYLKLAALEADAIPTNNAMRTSISAIVVALVTIAAETVAINARVERIKIIAIAITYPSMGLTVSRSPILFHPYQLSIKSYR